MQKALNERIGVKTDGMNDEEKTKWILNYCRAMSREMAGTSWNVLADDDMNVEVQANKTARRGQLICFIFSSTWRRCLA